jgi:hypothetical protein
MNHPRDLCDTYGHYSHHYPKLPQFLEALDIIRQLEFSSLENQTPIVEDLVLRAHERFLEDNSKPIIEIVPLEVKTDDNFMQILYLSTSMGSTMSKNVTFFFGVHQSIPVTPHVPLVSTSVESSFPSLKYTTIYFTYVNHVSLSHGIYNGFTTPYSTTSFGSVDSTSPIYHYGEDVIESLTTPNYLWDDLFYEPTT